jgi:hypothetical protein
MNSPRWYFHLSLIISCISGALFAHVRQQVATYPAVARKPLVCAGCHAPEAVVYKTLGQYKRAMKKARRKLQVRPPDLSELVSL